MALPLRRRSDAAAPPMRCQCAANALQLRGRCEADATPLRWIWPANVKTQPWQPQQLSSTQAGRHSAAAQRRATSHRPMRCRETAMPRRRATAMPSSEPRQPAGSAGTTWASTPLRRLAQANCRQTETTQRPSQLCRPADADRPAAPRSNRADRRTTGLRMENAGGRQYGVLTTLQPSDAAHQTSDRHTMKTSTTTTSRTGANTGAARTTSTGWGQTR